MIPEKTCAKSERYLSGIAGGMAAQHCPTHLLGALAVGLVELLYSPGRQRSKRCQHRATRLRPVSHMINCCRPRREKFLARRAARGVHILSHRIRPAMAPMLVGAQGSLAFAASSALRGAKHARPGSRLRRICNSGVVKIRRRRFGAEPGESVLHLGQCVSPASRVADQSEPGLGVEARVGETSQCRGGLASPLQITGQLLRKNAFSRTLVPREPVALRRAP